MYRSSQKQASSNHKQVFGGSDQELTRQYYFIEQNEFVPQDESDKTEFY